jgi:hypothetical protein
VIRGIVPRRPHAFKFSRQYVGYRRVSSPFATAATIIRGARGSFLPHPVSCLAVMLQTLTRVTRLRRYNTTEGLRSSNPVGSSWYKTRLHCVTFATATPLIQKKMLGELHAAHCTLSVFHCSDSSNGWSEWMILRTRYLKFCLSLTSVLDPNECSHEITSLSYVQRCWQPCDLSRSI